MSKIFLAIIIELENRDIRCSSNKFDWFESKTQFLTIHAEYFFALDNFLIK
jgi:hypothetical protein